MIAHLQAVKALLEPLGRPVYLVQAPATPSFPYYLVWPSTGAPGVDGALDQNADLSFLVGVTAVGKTFESAGIVARDGKAVLGPARFVPLVVAGRKASIRWSGLANADVDRDVTLTDTNAHPAFEAHLYRVESTPA